MKRSFRTFVPVVAGLLVLAASGCSPEPAPAAGGTMVVGNTVDLDSWNEYLSQQSFAVSLHRRIWLRLAQEAGKGADGLPRWEPLVAESWERSEDGRSLVFRLAKASWSDGAPLTSSDVRFTWKVQTSPEVAWVGAASKSRILDVETPDPRTVVFRFERPYPEQLADAVDGRILPEHVHGAVPFDRWRTHALAGLRPCLVRSADRFSALDLLVECIRFKLRLAPASEPSQACVMPDGKTPWPHAPTHQLAVPGTYFRPQ